MLSTHSKYSRRGFTLIEVVLAIGVFLISVLALIGLLAPMLQSVDEVEKIDEVTSVVNTVYTFLQSSSEIGEKDPDTGEIIRTKFESVYNAVADGGEATIFVYRYYDDSGPQESIRLEVGFSPEESQYVGNNAVVNQSSGNGSPADFGEAAGPIYRVVLSASSVIPTNPTALRTSDRNANGIYLLTVSDPDAYPEGSLPLEVRIFAEDPPGPANEFETETNLNELSKRKPDFTYNTAIVR